MALSTVFGLTNKIQILQHSLRTFDLTDYKGEAALEFTKKNKHYVLTQNGELFRLTDVGDGDPIPVIIPRKELNSIILGAKKTIMANESKLPELALTLKEIEGHKQRLRNRHKRRLQA